MSSKARILFGSNPASGHVRPGLPVARELSARDHEVVWYTSDRYRGTIERTGARHVGFSAGRDFDEADLDGSFPGRVLLRRRRLLRRGAGAALGGLRDHAAHRQERRVRTDGARPATAGRAAREAAQRRAQRPGPRMVVFASAHRRFQQVRAELGLEPSEPFFLDYTMARAPLYLQGTIPEFEYPRRDLPPNVRFVGALLPEAPGGTTLPDWWDELDEDRPVVLVSQGTVKIDPDLLLRPAIEALADEDVLVVVTTGGTAPEDVRSHHAADNVRIERFIPFADVLPKVDVVVINGGYGGTQQALVHGLPVVVAGVSEGKNEVAARVTWSGVGINLKTETPTPGQIRGAVRTLLHDASYRTRARDLQARYREHDGGKVAAELIESLLPAGMR